jgi:hypothetical protein
MTLTRTYQNELKSWLASFHSDAGLPKKAVTLTISEQKLIIQYEIRGEMPNIGKMRQAGKELAIASGTGAMVAGGMAMLIGRTLLGGALARVGVAGAFGAIGLGILGPAVLVGGTVAGVGYTIYKVGKNKAQNDQAQAFGQELLAHLKNFRPASLPPSEMAIVTSPDKRVTIIYDPDWKLDEGTPLLR